MTTAYIIHNSEGVPVRRTVDTFKDEDNSLCVIVATCDENWEEKFEGTLQELQDEYLSYRERDHHTTLRKEMRKEYGWRFEIYWPLSTIL